MGAGGVNATPEQIEGAALTFLPSTRIFQLAEMKMRQEAGMMMAGGGMAGGMGAGGMAGMMYGTG